MPNADQPPAARKGLKLSYDEYKQLANLLVMHLRQREEETAEGIKIIATLLLHKLHNIKKISCNAGRNNGLLL